MIDIRETPQPKIWHTGDYAPVAVGAAFTGESGKTYTVTDPHDSYNAVYGAKVLDPDQRECFVTAKEPEAQALVSNLGTLLSAKDGRLARLRFPEISRDVLEGRPVALVGYFDGTSELPDGDPDHVLTPDEVAFLGAFNTWIHNWDYKAEHVLVPKDGQFVGLIDFEKAFDFSHEDDAHSRADDDYKLKTAGMPNAEQLAKYARMIRNLGADEWAAIKQMARAAGLDKATATERMQMLKDRAKILGPELSARYGVGLEKPVSRLGRLSLR